MGMNTWGGSGGSTGQSATLGHPPQTEVPSDTTALETHLSFLRTLNKNLYSALQRSSQCADRLFGAQPAAIGEGANTVKSAQEPPLVMRVEEEARSCAQVLESIHQQITRLERV